MKPGDDISGGACDSGRSERSPAPTPSDTSEHIRAEVPPLLVAAVTVAAVVALERPVLAAAEVVGEKKGGGGTFSEEGEGAAAATAACLLLFSDVVGARDAMTGAAAAAPPEAAAAVVGESPLRQDEAGRVHQGETKVAAVMAIVLMALSLRCGCRGAEETTAGRGDSGARSRLRCFFGVGASSSSPAPSAPAGAVPVCFFWARNPTSSGSSFRLWKGSGKKGFSFWSRASVHTPRVYSARGAVRRPMFVSGVTASRRLCRCTTRLTSTVPRKCTTTETTTIV